MEDENTPSKPSKKERPIMDEECQGGSAMEVTPSKGVENSEDSTVTTFYLTPSAGNICIQCCEDVTIKYPNDKDFSKKRKLWDQSGKKTQICLDYEKVLGKS